MATIDVWESFGGNSGSTFNRGTTISIGVNGLYESMAECRFTVRHVASAQLILDGIEWTAGDGSARYEFFRIPSNAPTGKYLVSFAYKNQTTLVSKNISIV